MPTKQQKEERKQRTKNHKERRRSQAEEDAKARNTKKAVSTWAVSSTPPKSPPKGTPKSSPKGTPKSSPKGTPKSSPKRPPKDTPSPKKSTSTKTSTSKKKSGGAKMGFKVNRNSRDVAQMYTKKTPDTLPFLEIQTPSGGYIRPDGDTVTAAQRAEWRDRLRHAQMDQNTIKYLGLTPAALGANPRLRYGNKSRPFDASINSTNRQLLELASRISFFLDAGAHPYTQKSKPHEVHLEELLEKMFHAVRFLPPSDWRSNAMRNMLGWSRSGYAKEFRNGQ